MDETEAQDPLDGSFVEVSTTPAFECGICGRTFTKKDTLKRHLNVHDDGKFQCGKCTLFLTLKARWRNTGKFSIRRNACVPHVG